MESKLAAFRVESSCSMLMAKPAGLLVGTISDLSPDPRKSSPREDEATCVQMRVRVCSKPVCP